MFVQLGGKVLLCPSVDDQHTVAVAAFLLFFIGQFPLLYLDVVFLGKIAQGIEIVQLFMLHDEVNSRAAFATGEAFADIFGRRDVERGCFISMKRT